MFNKKIINMTTAVLMGALLAFGCHSEESNTKKNESLMGEQSNTALQNLEEPPHPLETVTSTRTARTISSGWSLWSPEKELNDIAIVDALDESTLSNIHSLWSWSANEGKWKVFLTGQKEVPEEYLKLTSLSSGQGYWILSDAAIDIQLTGDLPSKKNIAFASNANWQLVGFGGSGSTVDLESLIRTENDDPFCVWDFQNYSWDVFCSNETIEETNERLETTLLNPLTQFEAGKGYWVQANSGTLLTAYPPSPLSVTEFVFPDKNAPNVFNTRVSRMARLGVLDNGRRIVVNFKNGAGALIPCGTGEDNCLDGVRTYESQDLVNDQFSFIATTGFIRSFNAKIYNASDDLLYDTQGDINVDLSGTDSLTIAINLYPSGLATLSAGSLEKTIEFNIPLTDVSSSIFASADAGSIKGDFNCAQPSNDPLPDYPFEITFSHDSVNNTLSAAPVAMGTAFVGSPCTLKVTSQENGIWQLDGDTQFNVDADLAQSIPEIYFFNNVQDVLVGINTLDAPGELVINMAKDPLDDSIRTFLNDPNANLTYEINLNNANFDATATLSMEGDTLTGSVDYPLNEEVDLSLSVRKDGNAWISSTQKATFDIGTTTVPSFTVVFTKVVNVGISPTSGNIVITAVSGDTILENANVAISLVGASQTWQGQTDSAGRIRYVARNGLPSGSYNVTISKTGYTEETINFDLAENGSITRIVNLSPATGAPVLVAHYTFEDGSNLGQDTSPDGLNNGTPEANVTQVAGKVGSYAASFDGFSKISIPDSSAWSWGSDDFSISLWMKANSVTLGGTHPGLLTPASFGTNGNDYLSLYLDQSDGVAKYYSGVGPGTSTSVRSNNSLTDGNWHHVVVTRSGNDWKMYVDGVVQAVTATNNLTQIDANGPTFIGACYAAHINCGYIGHLDDIQVYHSSLSTNQVCALYSQGGETCP